MIRKMLSKLFGRRSEPVGFVGGRQETLDPYAPVVDRSSAYPSVWRGPDTKAIRFSAGYLRDRNITCWPISSRRWTRTR